MRRIESQNNGDRELAEQVLFWISSALKPLTLRELQDALAVEPGKPGFGEDNLPEMRHGKGPSSSSDATSTQTYAQPFHQLVHLPNPSSSTTTHHQFIFPSQGCGLETPNMALRNDPGSKPTHWFSAPSHPQLRGGELKNTLRYQVSNLRERLRGLNEGVCEIARRVRDGSASGVN
jgi:hypothetical protein